MGLSLFSLFSILGSGTLVSSVSSESVQEVVDVEVADGLTMTQFCDKIIELFLNEKPKSKDWRKYLVFREEWKKYRDRFHSRCLSRADAENDSEMKQKLITLSRKVKKVFDEFHHAFLFSFQLRLRHVVISFEYWN